MRPWILIQRRHAHQPDQRGAEARFALADERVRIGARNAGLLRLITGIHFDEQRRRAAFPGDCRFDGISQPRPIQRLNHVRQTYRIARLVRLQAADDVQREAVVSPKLRKLRHSLLQAVFAENRLTGFQCGQHRRDRLGLGHRDERDICGIAASLDCGIADAFAHLTQIVGNRRGVRRGNDVSHI